MNDSSEEVSEALVATLVQQVSRMESLSEVVRTQVFAQREELGALRSFVEEAGLSDESLAGLVVEQVQKMESLSTQVRRHISEQRQEFQQLDHGIRALQDSFEELTDLRRKMAREQEEFEPLRTNVLSLGNTGIASPSGPSMSGDTPVHQKQPLLLDGIKPRASKVSFDLPRSTTSKTTWPGEDNGSEGFFSAELSDAAATEPMRRI